MNKEKTQKRDLYYTKDHEWVDFQGSVAYVGICAFKLTGFKEIETIEFSELTGFKKQGEPIATVKYIDYVVEVHMPVDGKILDINKPLLTDNRNMLLQQPESNGWIALIIPAQPYERKGLLLPKEYQMSSKSKYARL